MRKNKIILLLYKIIKNTCFEGHVFCVGGAVRSFLLSDEPKDIDLCIDLPNGGINFANWLYNKGYLIHVPILYPTYGTAMFKLKEYPNIELEVVQTRKEQYHDENSRNPETCYGSLMEDCMRRDLTINSLYYDITNDKVLDLTGNGVNDIKEHRIRVTSTPDIVYSDDPLRILRCIRFSSRFGWEIDKETYQGMIDNVDRLSIITKERIQDELNKMLVCKHPVMAMELLKNTGAMKYVIPELIETYDMTQNAYHDFNTVWEHTMLVIENMQKTGFYFNSPNKLVLMLSALLHDIGKIKTRSVGEDGRVHFYRHELETRLVESILRRLKYSNDVIADVVFLIKNHMRTKNWMDDCSHMKDKSLRKFQYECGDKYYFDLLALIDADNKSHGKEHCLPNQAQNIDDRTAYMIDDGTDMLEYKLPVDGNDVMAYKGIKPGREVKEYLDYILKLCFVNPSISKEECLKAIKNYKIKIKDRKCNFLKFKTI